MPTTADYEIEEQKLTDSPPPTAPPKSRAKFILLAVLLIAAGGAVWYWLATADRVTTDDAEVDGHIVPIASKIYGNVLEVLVNDNQQVKKGDVLVRIDARDYQARVDQARAALLYAQSQSSGATVGVPLVREVTTTSTDQASAQLQAAEAELARATADYQRAAGADVSFARANVDAAEATMERAKADLDRMRPLVDKSEISKLQFDSYVAAAKVAESQLSAAKEKLSSASGDAATKKEAVAAAEARIAQAKAAVAQAQANKRQVTVQSAQAASAGAGVEQARANLETAELQYGYTAIVAPVDGRVTRKNVEAGQIVQQGQSLMTLVPLNDIWVTANFKETQLRNVAPGQRAEVHVDLSGRKFSGRVDSIAASTGARMSLLPPENATGNFVKVVQRIPVKIVLDPLPADAVLRPGMNVDATIFTR